MNDYEHRVGIESPIRLHAATLDRFERKEKDLIGELSYRNHTHTIQSISPYLPQAIEYIPHHLPLLPHLMVSVPHY